MIVQPPTTYDLADLFEHQDPVLFEDLLPSLLFWLRLRSGTRAPVVRRATFLVEIEREARRLDLVWDAARLADLAPALPRQLQALDEGRTVARERATENAGYVLALIALSAFEPRRRVLHFNTFAAPDLIFDDTPGAERGVEVAARTRGGQRVLVRIRDHKLPGLLARPGYAEIQLSLWSGRPRAALIERVR